MNTTILRTPQGLQIECTDTIEVWRVTTIMKKERGTIRWLESIRPDDVVYDVGANIGLYALVAAMQGAHVYAFEPHVANAARLLRNLALNESAIADRTGVLKVLTVALHDHCDFLPFNYLDSTPGSSGSQLGHTTLETGHTFVPAATELKCAVQIDGLVEDGVIEPATMVKIDVDGNEPAVLRGMSQLLARGCVRSVQVEIHPNTDAEILALMTSHDYDIAERHHTSNGTIAISRGADPMSVPHNAVFTRKESQYGG